MFQDQVLENTILGKFATLTTDFAAKLEFNLQLMYVGSVWAMQVRWESAKKKLLERADAGMSKALSG